MIEKDINQYIVELREQSDVKRTWDQIAVLVNALYDTELSGDAARKRYSNYMKSQLIEEAPYVSDMIERKQENDERTQLNAIYRTLAREDSLKQIAHDIATQVSSKKILNYTLPKEKWCNQLLDGTLLIGDWHYGIEIENMFNSYNCEVARRRISELRDRVVDICIKNNLTHLNIVNLGDMIAGKIHLPLRINSRIDVITQIMDVSEILSELLADICNEGIKIDYYSVIDNHSRVDENKKDAIQLESLARITDWYLRERLEKFPVKFHDNAFGPTIATFEIFNHNIVAVHGDKDKQKTMISSLNNFTQQHNDLIVTAHLHHVSCDEACGTFMIANGSLMGTDEYAHDLRLHSPASQTFILSTPDNVVEQLNILRF